MSHYGCNPAATVCLTDILLKSCYNPVFATKEEIVEEIITFS